MTQNRGLGRALYAIAGAGPIAFLAIATIEGFLRRDYDAIADPISALALGPRAWVQELNFGLLAASFVGFALVLQRAFRGGVASRSAPAVLGAMAIGAVLAGMFAMDAPGQALTRAGELHELASLLVFPSIPLLAFVTARRFRRDAAWRPYFWYTLATGAFCLASLAFFMVFVGDPSTHYVLGDYRGLVQRIVVVPFVAWIALVTRAAYVARRQPE